MTDKHEREFTTIFELLYMGLLIFAFLGCLSGFIKIHRKEIMKQEMRKMEDKRRSYERTFK